MEKIITAPPITLYMIRNLLRGVVKTASVRTVARMEKRVEDKLNRALKRHINLGIQQAKSEFYNATLITFSILLIIAGILLIASKHFSLEYFLIIAGTTLLFLTTITKL